MFLQLVKGKTVCLVGNGPSLLDIPRGERIDAHNVVVRFNAGGVDHLKYPNDAGEKFTVWVIGGPFSDSIIDQAEGRYELAVLVRPFTPGNRKRLKLGASLDLPRGFVDKADLEFRTFLSSGALIAIYLTRYSEHVRLSLVGFDHGGGKYFDPEAKADISQSKESKLFAALRERDKRIVNL